MDITLGLRTLSLLAFVAAATAVIVDAAIGGGAVLALSHP
jgi:hypothetical protein